MKESKIEITNLRNFLDSHRVATLGTVSAENKAHVSTVYYFADETLCFYFVTKNHTVKYRNLDTNDSVALCISDEKALMTVQLEGTAQRFDLSEDMVTIAHKLKIAPSGTHIGGPAPISKLYGSFIFYRITPSWLRWVDYGDNWTETSILELNDFSKLLESK